MRKLCQCLALLACMIIIACSTNEHMATYPTSEFTGNGNNSHLEIDQFSNDLPTNTNIGVKHDAWVVTSDTMYKVEN